MRVETLVMPLRNDNTDLIARYEAMLLSSEIFLIPINQAILKQAASIRSTTNLKTPDAIHAASALNLGVTPGLSIYLQGVKLTKTKGLERANLAAKWKRNYRGKSAEKAWFILTQFRELKQALSAYQKRFGIEEMFRDYKSGGYNLESTGLNNERLIALIILITLVYISSIMSGEKIKQEGVVKYVGRVKKKRRTPRRHNSFYISLHGYAWVESLDLFSEQTAKLMSLSPHKLPYYQRGRRAEILIQSTFEL